MEECGCVIICTSNGASVKLCSAHGYGTEMLPVLRRFIAMCRELEGRHGHRLLAAYTELLHEAQALLQKVGARQEQEGRATTAPSPVEKHKVMDVPERHSTLPERKKRVRQN